MRCREWEGEAGYGGGEAREDGDGGLLRLKGEGEKVQPKNKRPSNLKC